MKPAIIATIFLGGGAIRVVADGRVSAVTDLLVPYDEFVRSFGFDENVRCAGALTLRDYCPGNWRDIDVNGDDAPLMCINASAAARLITGTRDLLIRPDDYDIFISHLVSAYIGAAGLDDNVRDEVRDQLLAEPVDDREAAVTTEHSA